MTGMDELITWLRAALDEDERVARAASAGPWRYDPTKHHREPGTVRFSEGVFKGPAGRDAICIASTGETDDPQSMADAEHIARWDPARVLAEVDASRRILDLHPTVPEDWAVEIAGDCRTCSEPQPCGTLRALALPYADQPGYQDDWRP